MREVKLVKRLWSENEGQNLNEYALILVLLALTGIAVINPLASELSSFYTKTSHGLIAAAANHRGTKDFSLVTSSQSIHTVRLKTKDTKKIHGR